MDGWGVRIRKREDFCKNPKTNNKAVFPPMRLCKADGVGGRPRKCSLHAQTCAPLSARYLPPFLQPLFATGRDACPAAGHSVGLKSESLGALEWHGLGGRDHFLCFLLPPPPPPAKNLRPNHQRAAASVASSLSPTCSKTCYDQAALQSGGSSPGSGQAKVIPNTFHLKTFSMELLGIELGRSA